jgi:hypothetical protein
MRLPLVVLSFLVLVTVVLVIGNRPSAPRNDRPRAVALADTLVGEAPPPQCDPAYDQRVMDEAAAKIRGELQESAAETEIMGRIATEHARLRDEGGLSCSDTERLATETVGGQFGAIAVGPNARWGASWDHPSQAEANQRALGECPGCSVVVRVVGPTCGAYAASRSTSGWGTDATPEAAQARAMTECNARGSRCRVVAYACNTR